MTLTDNLRKGLIERSAKKREDDPALDDKPPSLVKMIDDVLDMSTQDHHFFRPSMLFGCNRQNYFHYRHVPYTKSKQAPRMLRILDNGTHVHLIIQDYLEHHPEYWFAKESKVHIHVEGALIRGSCDGVLIRRSDLYRFGVEIKSINHDEWVKLSKPKPFHVLQASVYAKLHGLKYIVVLYWDKNTHNLKEFVVKVRKDTWREVRERVKLLKSYVDSNKVPKFDPSTCSLDFCNYIPVCRKHGAPV